MDTVLVIGLVVVFVIACLTSAYEAKPGVPKKHQ